MNWFLLLIPILALAGAAQIVYALGDLKRRWRRLVNGTSLILMLVPAWLLMGDGTLIRPSTVLFLIPDGKSDLSALDDVEASTASLRLTPEFNTFSTKESLPQLNWLTKSSRQPRSMTGVSAVSIKNWSDISSASLTPWYSAFSHGLVPKPIVALVDSGSSRLGSILPDQIEVTNASMELKKQGASFYRLKVDGDGMGGGRLELTVRDNGNAKSLRTMSTKIEVSLVGCPYEAIDGKYTLRAWLDAKPDLSDPKADFAQPRSESINPTNQRTHLLVGSNPLDRRMTVLPLSELEPNSIPLPSGYHNVQIELEFMARIDKVEIPITYRASTYFEVTERELVIFANASTPKDFIRHSWVHRNLSLDLAPGAKTIAEVPDSAGALLERILGEDKSLESNQTRTPFTKVTIVNSADEIVAERLNNASLLILSEPKWEDLIKINKSVGDYIGRGNSVLVIAPPRPGDAASIPWLPATVHSSEPISRCDPRIYLLPDASRPASLIGLPQKPNVTGSVLQQKLFNGISQSLRIYSPYDASQPSVLMTTHKSRLVVADEVSGVMRSDYATNSDIWPGGWSVIPPVFMRSNETTLQTSKAYNQSNGAINGAIFDLAPSWVSPRLGLLERAQREEWYSVDCFKGAFSAPSSVGVSAKTDLDLPMDIPVGMGGNTTAHYPNTVAVIAALDVPQAKARWVAGTPPTSVPIEVWMNQPSSEDELPNFAEIKKIVDGGMKVVIVPIKLDSKFFGDGVYGNKLITALTDSKIGAQSNLADLAKDTGATLTSPLQLDSTEKDIDQVVQEVLELIRDSMADSPRFHWNEGSIAHAVDRRTRSSVDVTCTFQPLELTAAGAGVQPAASIKVGSNEFPILVTMPYKSGAATSIGFSPFSFDRWFEDRGHESRSGSGDGWGLQRLIDPVVRMTGSIGKGTPIEALELSDDRRQLQITCSIPPIDETTETLDLPKLTPVMQDGVSPPELLVTVTKYDDLKQRLYLSVSTMDELPVAGEYRFEWTFSSISSTPAIPAPSLVKSGRQIFVSLFGQGDPAGNVRERLDRIAFQTGGGAVEVEQFRNIVKSARFESNFLGTCLLVALSGLLLSPLSRAWVNPIAPLYDFIRRKAAEYNEGVDADDEADALAAVDSSGMSCGLPAAQRPAGPIVQLRPMRPGDSALAVPANRWILFVPEIADSIGSPPLPPVYETPKPQAMSIATVLDLHAGINAHERGAKSDRMRVIKRIAMLNASASARRGGSHRVVALQARDSLENTEAGSLDQVLKRITELRSSIGKTPQVPEFLENEMVVFITDPASMTEDGFLERLARECGENVCDLTCIILIHPEQLNELGNRVLKSPATLCDRSDLDSSLIQNYHDERFEKIASMLGIIDSRTVLLSCTQSTDEIAKVLEDETWTRS